MFKKIIIGQIRHLLTTSGGMFVAQGFVTADEFNQIHLEFLGRHRVLEATSTVA